MSNNINISWEIASQDSTKFFYDAVNDDGDIEKRMGRLKRAVVVVTFNFANGKSEKIAFIKTNRGKTYRDSRTPNTNISESDFIAEFTRWFDSYEASRAVQALNF